MGKYVELEAVLDAIDRLNVFVDGLINAEELAVNLKALPTQDGELERLREAVQAAEEHITTMLTAIAGGNAESGQRFADKDPVVLQLRAALAEYRKWRDS